MADELDEFGIPIRKSPAVNAESQLDEFGIPKKKAVSSTKPSTGSVTNGGSSSLGWAEQKPEQKPFDLSTAPAPTDPVKKPVRLHLSALGNYKPIPLQEQVAQSYRQDPTAFTEKVRAENKPQQDEEENIINEKLDQYKKKYGDSYWGGVKSGMDEAARIAARGLSRGGVNLLQGVMSTADLVRRRALGGEAATPEEEKTNNDFIKKLEDKTSFGLEDKFRGTTPVTRAVGSLAEFVPAMLSAEATGGLSFALNGAGTADKEIRHAVENGAKFENGADDLYRVGKMVTDYTLMKALNSHVLFNKLPAAVRDDLAGRATINAMKSIAESGEQITAESIASAMKGEAVSIAKKIPEFLNKGAKAYRNTALDLSALSYVDNELKKKANDISGSEVLPAQNPEEMANTLRTILSEDAPIFAGFGMRQDVGMMFNKSPYKNVVIDAVKADRSPENIEKVVQDIGELGKKQGWSDQDIENTKSQAKVIADAVATIPEQFTPKQFNESVDLITGRNEMQEALDIVKQNKPAIDPGLGEVKRPEEIALENKIDQSNDKLKELATGLKTKYSFDEEKGTYTKQIGNEKPVEITKERYNLEETEKSKPEDVVPNTSAQDQVSAQQPVEEINTNPNIEPSLNTQQNEKIPTLPAEADVAQKAIPETGNKETLSPTQIERRNAIVSGSEGNIKTDLSKYAPKLYREISFDELGNFLENGNGQRDFYLADHPDLALGQGGNTGVKLTMKSDGIDGFVDLSKPAMKLSFEQGKGEYKTEGVTPSKFIENLEKVEISPKAKRSQSKDMRYIRILDNLVADGAWKKSEAKDGTVVYEKSTDTLVRENTVDNQPVLGRKAKAPKKTYGYEDIDAMNDKKEIADNLYQEIIDPTELSLKEQAIRSSGGFTTTPDSYAQFGDRNNITKDINKNYLKESGKPLDVIAQELSKEGLDITPADLVNYMDKFSTGEQTYSPRAEALKQKLFDVTGKKYNKFTVGKFREKLAREAEAKMAADPNIMNKEIVKIINEEGITKGNLESMKDKLEFIFDEKTYDNIKKYLDGKESGNGAAEVNGPSGGSGGLEQRAGDPLRTFAGKIREGKISKLGGFRAGTGFDGAWDFGLEALATAIEGGAKVADAIQIGLKAIQGTNWYKGLANKEEFDKQYMSHMESEYGKVEESFSALKNADIAEKRAELGLEERVKPTTKSNEQLVKDANEKIKSGYDVESLIDGVLDGKREARDEEVIILKEYQLAKEQELIDIGDKIVEATAAGKGTSLDKLIADRDMIIQDIDRAYQAGERTGTVSARALQARKVALMNDYSLANMLIQKRKGVGGEKLSTEQIDQVTSDYNKIKKLNEELTKKMQQLEADNNELKASKALKGLKGIIEFEERKMGRVEQRASIDNQINETLDNLSKKLKQQAGKLSMNAIPVELIPDIAKLAKLYAKKGINTMEGIVDKVFHDLKGSVDGLDKKEIEYILINFDYDKLAKEEARLKNFKTRTENRTKDLRERTANNDFARRKFEPLKLDEEALNIQKELRQAKYSWDLALEKDVLARRTNLEKYRDYAAEILNIPRQLMATLDLSAPLRQGLVLSINNPRIAGKSFIEMLRQTRSQERFDKWYDDLIESPGYAVMKESGLYIANQRRASLAAREEQFMSNLVEKIPVIGPAAKGSERAYVGYLNKLRADVFTRGAIEFENEGKTFETDQKLYEALATYVNAATGRGDLGKIENSAQILNSLFFSPRLIASRVRLLTNWANPVWYSNTPKEVRYMYAKDMSRLILFGTTILGLAAMAGADVEKDPRSSDFGKIKVGDKRWDIWGGFQQFVRFFAQVGSGQRKSTTDLSIRDIDGKGFQGETRADLVLNMMRSKLAPVPATAWNLAAGKTMIGDEFTWKDVPKSFLPLFAADLYRATSKDGFTGLLGSSVGAFGVGVQDYSKAADKPMTEAEIKSEIKKALDELKKQKK